MSNSGDHRQRLRAAGATTIAAVPRAAAESQQSQLEQALARQERDREIVRLRGAGRTPQQIADRVGLSRERVRQILKAAMSNGSILPEPKKTDRRRAALDAARARREEILSLWRTGAPLSELARTVGVPVSAARRVVAECGSGEDSAGRGAALCALSAAATPRYSDAQLVAAIQAVAGELGYPPNQREYARLAGSLGLPGRAIIGRRLGWTEAVHAAGLPARQAHGGPEASDRDRCLAAVEAVALSLGRPPTMREYDQARSRLPGAPSAVTVVQRVGRWAEVKVRVARMLTRAEHGQSDVAIGYDFGPARTS